MTEKRKSDKQHSSREDRLRAALRANLGRRKAQARARADKEEQVETTDQASEADAGETKGNA